MDYFDASINRIAAAALGVRTTQKALLQALLTPYDTLKAFEAQGNFTARLRLMEQLHSLPFGEVWEAYCAQQDVPSESSWLQKVNAYETAEFVNRV